MRLCAWLLFGLFCWGFCGGQQPVVETKLGKIGGEQCSSSSVQYLGIPFAQPPLGQLRWKPPVAYNTPYKNGFLNATQFGPECMQLTPMSKQSEDCLYLNVYTPSGTPPPSGWPVMFFVHGGSFVSGGADIYYYDGCWLAARFSTVVVTTNYRLGPFGFLARSDLQKENPNFPTTGNYGIQDQRLALQWVQDNVAPFGGNNSRVLLFGESAGAFSVFVHLVATRSKGLFSRALAESGSGDAAYRNLTTALGQGAQLSTKLGCNDPNSALQCLRAKDAQTILTALPLKDDLILKPGVSYGPVVGDVELPDVPRKLVEKGEFNRVPFTMGSNQAEGNLFIFSDFPSFGGVTLDTVQKWLALSYPPSVVDKIIQNYPLSKYNNSYWNVASQIFGDSIFTCPTRRMARVLSQANIEVYKYLWTHVPRCPFLGSLVPRSAYPKLGATHFSEVTFVFSIFVMDVDCAMQSDEQTLSKWLSGYWSTFADTGSPNSASAPAVWPNFTFRNDLSLRLDLPHVSVVRDVDKQNCDLWDEIVFNTGS